VFLRRRNNISLSDSVPPVEPAEPQRGGGLDPVQPGYLGPTPPAGLPPQRGERLWVERPEQLLQAVTMLQQANVIAIDAEFTQARSRVQGESGSSVPRLALLQLAIDQHCFVVDAWRLNNLAPLAPVVEDPDKAILLHGAGADMRVMAERGLYVAHYYDLEATCRSIFGQHESSLAAMLQRAFAIRLDKSLQRTDWTRRPLPPAMVAYAARDAEVTLALYHWLKQYYPDILQLHEYSGEVELVASWIEPFLRGSSALSPEMAVLEAQAQGIIANKDQIVEDCRAALSILIQPMRRSRLLRLITDLSLIQLVPDIIPLLEAPTSDERASSARALGRLDAKSAHDALLPLLQDPVYDVRKAAHAALTHLDEKEPRPQRAAPSKAADGTRSWVVESSTPADGEDGWKARLRSIMDS